MGYILSHSIFFIQQRISKILILIGSLSIIFNFCTGFYHSYSFLRIISTPGVSVVVVLVIALLLTHNVDKGAVRWGHVGIFILNAFLAILDQYNSFFGIGLYILGIIVMYRYRYFMTFAKVKIFSLIMLLFTFIELSSFLIHSYTFGESTMVSVFVIFFILVIYTMYKDEIDNILFLEKINKKSMDEMIREKNKTIHDMNVSDNIYPY